MSWKISLGFLFVLIWSCGGGALAFGETARWIKIEGYNLELYSDIGEKETSKIAKRLIAQRMVCDEMVLAGYDPMPRDLIFVFKDLNEMQQSIAPIGDGVIATKLIAPITNKQRIRVTSAQMWHDSAPWLMQSYARLAAVDVLPALPPWAVWGLGNFLSQIDVSKDQAQLGRIDNAVFKPNAWANEWSQLFRYAELSARLRPGIRGLASQGDADSWMMVRRLCLADPSHMDAGIKRLHEITTVWGTEKESLEALWNEPLGALRGSLIEETKKTLDVRVPIDLKAVWSSVRVYEPAEDEIESRLLRIYPPTDMARALAWTKLKELKKSYPNSPYVLETMADLEIQFSHWREGGELRKAAIIAGSRNVELYLDMAVELMNTAGTNLFDNEGSGGAILPEALPLIERALELSPKNTYGYFLLGRAYFLSPNIDESMPERLTLGITNGPTGALVRCYRGLAYQRLAMFEKAADDYQGYLYLLKKDPATAKRIVQRLEGVVDRMIYAGINHALDTDDFTALRAEIAAWASRFPAARCIFEERSARVSEAENWSTVKKAAADLNWVTAVERANVYLERYSQGEYRESAAAILEKAKRMISSGSRI